MNTDDTNYDYHFLSKGGRCGKLIRSKNWGETTIGHPERWPASLQTAVSVCLNSPLSIMINWGDDLTMIYNDACAAMLGVQHPHAIGRSLKEGWPQAAEKINEAIQQVIRTAAGYTHEDMLFIINRGSKEEETYFTCSHCPILNEAGVVEGIFTTFVEKTQIILERQLNALLRKINRSLVDTDSRFEIYQKTSSVFHEDPYNFPFTIFYEVTDNSAYRVCVSGENVSEKISPQTLRLDTHELFWPLKKVPEHGSFLLMEKIGDLPAKLPLEKMQRLPAQVVLFSIETKTGAYPRAILIIGLNPYSTLNNVLLKFFQLVVDQIIDRLAAIEKQTAWIRYAHEQSIKVDQQLEHLRYISNHDLREPLRKIRTFTNTLHRTWRNRSEEKYLKKIDESAAQMSKLIQDVLDYANLSQPNTGRDAVDLTNALESAIHELKDKIDIKKAIITYNVLHKTKGSAKQFIRLFKCLLENSLKFCEHIPMIKISSQQINLNGSARSGLYTEITLTDNGIGFDQQHASKAFLIFQKLHDKKIPGNGIGLTLCRKIVENHRGSINLFSEINKGTVVRILLPAAGNLS
jgi:signal transduction histidine kinase